MTDPLHVEVARALGWTELHLHDGKWCGVEPYGGLKMVVPRYDTSWCSIGPIIDRLKLNIIHSPGTPSGKIPPTWICSTSGPNSDGMDGKTACEAVAKTIVHLKKEGKLPND